MKVVFDLTDRRLVIEGDGPELLKVLQAARDLAPNISQIQIITAANDSLQSDSNQIQSPPPENQKSEQRPPPSTPPATLRQFSRSLALNNTYERIAIIAYYVNKVENRQTFSPKEIDGWFTMCGYQKPTQMGTALFDCKRKYGFIENIGRGMWKISTQGENLILRKLEECGSQS